MEIYFQVDTEKISYFEFLRVFSRAFKDEVTELNTMCEKNLFYGIHKRKSTEIEEKGRNRERNGYKI